MKPCLDSTTAVWFTLKISITGVPPPFPTEMTCGIELGPSWELGLCVQTEGIGTGELTLGSKKVSLFRILGEECLLDSSLEIPDGTLRILSGSDISSPPPV